MQIAPGFTLADTLLMGLRIFCWKTHFLLWRRLNINWLVEMLALRDTVGWGNIWAVANELNIFAHVRYLCYGSSVSTLLSDASFLWIFSAIFVSFLYICYMLKNSSSYFKESYGFIVRSRLSIMLRWFPRCWMVQSTKPLCTFFRQVVKWCFLVNIMERRSNSQCESNMRLCH